VSDYEVIIGSDIKLVKRAVGDLLVQGWTPAGGISICYDPDGILMYAQAMVLDDPI
jgi:hypothetical protein